MHRVQIISPFCICRFNFLRVPLQDETFIRNEQRPGATSAAAFIFSCCCCCCCWGGCCCSCCRAVVMLSLPRHRVDMSWICGCCNWRCCRCVPWLTRLRFVVYAVPSVCCLVCVAATVQLLYCAHVTCCCPLMLLLMMGCRFRPRCNCDLTDDWPFIRSNFRQYQQYQKLWCWRKPTV